MEWITSCEAEQNPYPVTLVDGVYHFSPTCGKNNTLGGPATCPTGNSGRTNPALGSFTLGENGATSRYDSLQASLTRRLSQNLQAQASYTWSLCDSDGDAVLNSLSGNAPNTYENPYNREYDRSRCSYNATQVFRLNALYDLPFQKNRLVSGWQISGIWSASTGLPFNIIDGVGIANASTGSVSERPNYAPNNPATVSNGISYPACNNSPIIGTATLWYNPNCFAPEAFGTLGNFGREGLIGPGIEDVDMALLKTTKIRERCYSSIPRRSVQHLQPYEPVAAHRQYFYRVGESHSDLYIQLDCRQYLYGGGTVTRASVRPETHLLTDCRKRNVATMFAEDKLAQPDRDGKDARVILSFTILPAPGKESCGPP